MTNEMAANNTIDPSQLVAGQMLAQQREKLGLSVEECANTLKLSVVKIEALESGDSKPFVSETFIRGYLKSYAKLLGLTEAEVIDGYQSQKSGASCIAGSGQSTIDSTTSRWWLPYIVGIVIILLWFAISSQLESQKKRAALLDSDKVEQPNLQASPLLQVDNDGLSVDGVLLNNSAELDAVTVESVDESVELKGEDAQEFESEEDNSALNSDDVTPLDESDAQLDIILPSVEPLVDTGEEVVAGSDQLLFTFAEDCWVEIVDADNATIVSSLRAENTELLVRGKAPFFIILGNISGATLHFNGEPIALNNSRDGRTLRLNLGS